METGEFMKRIKAWIDKLEKCYPPGYAYRWELAVTTGLILAAVCFSLRFLARLDNAVSGLYYYDSTAALQLVPNVTMEPFHRLVRGSWQFFWLPALSQGAMAVSHYCYYYRDTRSIYLMRRLPQKKPLPRSCLAAPLLCLGLTTLVMAVLCLFYLGCYFLAVPPQCLPSL